MAKSATATAKKISLRPLYDKVIVQPAVAEEKTSSGILLPDTAREKPMQGKVIAAGPGRVNEDGNLTPLGVKAGDTVVYGKYAGTEVKLDDETYIIIAESELLAKLD
jgi:chaperonin GroES